MELKPSEVFYTQDSISNRFGDYTPHGSLFIGETLDQLLNGSCYVSNIPNISVVRRSGKYFTSDNRRLWVFRKAEEIGFLKTIYVYETRSINPQKFTTTNGGIFIRVRGDPGGSTWRRWRPKSETASIKSVNVYYSKNAMSPRTTTAQFLHQPPSHCSSYGDDHNILRSPGPDLTNYHSQTSSQWFGSNCDDDRRSLGMGRVNSPTTSKPDHCVISVEQRNSLQNSVNNSKILSKDVTLEPSNQTGLSVDWKWRCTIL